MGSVVGHSLVGAEMNRFSERKLDVSGPALAARPVREVFKTGQVDAFAAALRTYGLVEVGRSDDRWLELARPSIRPYLAHLPARPALVRRSALAKYYSRICSARSSTGYVGRV